LRANVFVLRACFIFSYELLATYGRDEGNYSLMASTMGQDVKTFKRLCSIALKRWERHRVPLPAKVRTQLHASTALKGGT
jgi:hypothetical protein